MPLDKMDKCRYRVKCHQLPSLFTYKYRLAVRTYRTRYSVFRRICTGRLQEVAAEQVFENVRKIPDKST